MTKSTDQFWVLKEQNWTEAIYDTREAAEAHLALRLKGDASDYYSLKVVPLEYETTPPQLFKLWYIVPELGGSFGVHESETICTYGEYVANLAKRNGYATREAAEADIDAHKARHEARSELMKWWSDKRAEVDKEYTARLEAAGLS